MGGVEAGERPFPPGDYPVVVVGSGAGALQTSYCLSRLGIRAAVLSRDERPGGMFLRFPIFQRLLSGTKPDAPYERGTREYEWYDHNSLVGDERAHQALVPELMDRSFFVPSRAEMEAGLAAFAEAGGVQVRYGCEWQATRREDESYVLETTDGEYRAPIVVFAPGVTEPWKPDIAGLDAVPHYGDTRPPEEYAGKTVLVVGKRNSAFEVASGLLQWARTILLVSPRPVDTAVLALATVSARYLQPIEDAGMGGGTFLLDAAIERVERTAAGYRVRARGTTREGVLELEADEAVAATGFRAPLGDLARLGVATVAQGRIPALTPFWESVGAPGLYFAGNASQGAAGLRKHGVGSSSPVVRGFRYNARVLARHIARRLGVPVPVERVPAGDAVSFLLRHLTSAPELWAQKSYLARIVSPDGETEILPLAHWLDDPQPRSVASAVEMNADGAIYPVVYAERDGDVHERALEGNDLNDFRGDEYRRALEALL